MEQLVIAGLQNRLGRGLLSEVGKMLEQSRMPLVGVSGGSGPGVRDLGAQQLARPQLCNLLEAIALLELAELADRSSTRPPARGRDLAPRAPAIQHAP